MTNEEVIARAKEEIRLRGLSKATEHEYLGRLKAFIKYYENQPLQEMTETEIRAFLLHLIDERGVAAATANVYNSALRFIFGAVLERNLNYQMIPRRRIHRQLLLEIIRDLAQKIRADISIASALSPHKPCAGCWIIFRTRVRESRQRLMGNQIPELYQIL